MYTQVSEEFKNIVKSNSITATAKLVFKEPNITLCNKATDTIKSSLEELVITDTCCDKGKIFGTAMAKEVEVSIINKDDLDLADKEFELFVGVKLANGNYEYVPYGNYIVTKYTDTKSNNKFKIIAYDYMSKFNGEIKENKKLAPTFPITLKEFKKLFVESYGMKCVDQSLPNDNFLVKSMPNYDGITGRTILAKMAELQGCFAKITRDNQVKFYFLNKTTEKIDAMSMNSKLDMNKPYGPVNVVSIGMENIEGENVTLQDEVSIKQYGETAIKINDNPFLYNQATREEAIRELYNHFKGFTYTPVKFNYKARLYTECGDTMQCENVENKQFVDSIIMNQIIKIPATRQSTIDSPAITMTGVKNKYISQTEQKGKHTEIIVDKQNQKITSVVNQIGDRSYKKSSITQDIDNVTSKVEAMASIYNVAEGVGQISIKDNVKEGKIVELHIYGNNTVFDLFPDSNLLPSAETLPHKGKSIIQVIQQGKPIQEYDIKVDGVLRQRGNVHDEYVLKNGKAKIIRRVNEDGSVKDIPTEAPAFAFEIPLFDGENIVKIKDDYALMKAMYVPINEFTDTFATKVEMNSTINQTRDSINLSVDKKLENYSTTTDMNSAIDLKTSGITATVTEAKQLASEANTKATNAETTANGVSGIANKASQDAKNALIKSTKVEQTTTALSTEVKQKVGKDEIGTQIEQNAEAVRLAWNNISQNIQFTQENGDAKIQIKENANNKLMDLDKTGQHFFKNGNQILGEMGVKKVGDSNLVCFNLPVKPNEQLTDGMAWGATLPNGTFLPILYIKDFLYYENMGTVAPTGNMILNGCNLKLAGPSSSIQSGGVKMHGDMAGSGLFFEDENTYDTLLAIYPNDEYGTPMSVEIINGEMKFFDNQSGSKSLTIGSDPNNNCLLTTDGSIVATTIIHRNSVTQESLEKFKKNIVKYNKKAIDEIKNTDIYTYNYKNEKDTDKKHVGFVIGDKYKASNDIISMQNNEPKGADLYSMISVAYKAIQEQQEIIEKQQKQIEQLQNQLNNLTK